MHPGDGNAMGTYTEQYQYDAVGNFLKLIHAGTSPINPGWSRLRLQRGQPARARQDQQPAEQHRCERSRAAERALHLRPAWQHGQHAAVADHAVEFQGRTADDAAAGRECRRHGWHFASGRTHLLRVRWRWAAGGARQRNQAAGIKIKERLYVGAFEVYREYDANGNVKLARETLHVMDDKKPVALVETKTVDSAASPGSVPSTNTRYQFSNLLGSGPSSSMKPRPSSRTRSITPSAARRIRRAHARRSGPEAIPVHRERTRRGNRFVLSRRAILPRGWAGGPVATPKAGRWNVSLPVLWR